MVSSVPGWRTQCLPVREGGTYAVMLPGVICKLRERLVEMVDLI